MEKSTSKENFHTVTDFEPSILSTPFVAAKGKIYCHCYAASFPELDLHFLLLAGSSWRIDQLDLKVTAFDKNRLAFTLAYQGLNAFDEARFSQRYLRFYSKLVLEMYTLSEDKCRDAIVELSLIRQASDLLESLQKTHKNYLFFPGKLQQGKVVLDEQLVNRCLEYWHNSVIGHPYTKINAEEDILQARYGKMARYTLVKRFGSIREEMASVVYDFLYEPYSKEETTLKEEAKEILNKKFYFPYERLKTMTIEQFLISLPEMPQAYNDFYSVKQIEKFHGFDPVPDDSLVLLLPIANVRSILCSNPKENVKERPMNQNFKQEFQSKKPGVRHIFLLGKYLRKSPLKLSFWNRLVLLPLGLFDLERRLINLDIERRFKLELPSVGEACFWRALQTQMVDNNDNYETLETLGDSVLKMIVTLIIFSKFNFQECKMTFLRMKIISNFNLQVKGINQKIFKFVYHNHRKIAKWTPGLMKNEMDKRPTYNQIPSCMVADIMESLIGAMYLAANRRLDPVLKFMTSSGIWPQKEAILIFQDTQASLPHMIEMFRGAPLKSFHDINSIQDDDLILDSTYLDLFKKTPFKFPREGLSRESVGSLLERRIEMLEEVIEYSFKDKEVVKKILERKQNSRDFERFEFLGDAAIEFRVVDLCFTIMPKYYRYFEPHDLHKAKIYLLSNHNLSFFTSFFYLDTFVEEDMSAVCSEVRRYAEQSLFGQFLRHEVSTMKLLGDLWESLMAAVLVDGGWPAFDALYTRAVLPFVVYICRFSKYLEGSAKSAAFEIIEKKRLSLEPKQSEQGWVVKILDEQRNQIEEFAGETQSAAEELCYFYISYNYEGVKNR